MSITEIEILQHLSFVPFPCSIYLLLGLPRYLFPGNSAFKILCRSVTSFILCSSAVRWVHLIILIDWFIILIAGTAVHQHTRHTSIHQRQRERISAETYRSIGAQWNTGWHTVAHPLHQHPSYCTDFLHNRARLVLLCHYDRFAGMYNFTRIKSSIVFVYCRSLKRTLFSSPPKTEIHEWRPLCQHQRQWNLQCCAVDYAHVHLIHIIIC